jgi:nucleotide-binding universal stress UspA family protein
MTYLVGYTPDRSGSEALALARMLTQGTDLDLVVCMVMPEAWGYPSPANVDAEYKVFLDQHARKSLDKARAMLGGGTAARFVSTAARSAPTGLARMAEQAAADLIILGSPRDGPPLRCAFGAVASGLISESSRPLALTPRGFKRETAARLERVTCAYVADSQGGRTLAAAADLARRHRVPLRLVTFVVRDRQMYPSSVGYDAENLVANSWREQAVAAQAAAVASLPREVTASTAVGDGRDWRHAIAAIDWRAGDVLVAGGHSTGIWSGLVFGSVFTRLLRYATVPIIAVPAAARAGDSSYPTAKE